ncbi:MAG: serine hydrolase [Patescibacteria group bacterium]
MTKNIKFFLITFILSLAFWQGVNFSQNTLENFFYAQISEPFGQIVEIKIPQKPPLRLEVNSAISIKINPNGREKILFRKNTSEIMPLASLTKLMTAIIVLEDVNYDLKRLIITSKSAAEQENVPDYGNLKAGERLTVEKLLELMLSYSSNDAAYSLSELTGVNNFVDKMNLKAHELGLTQTNFLNSTGLEDAQNNFNYSTAENLAVLTKYILKNHPLIFEITSRKKMYLIKNGVSDLILADSQAMLGGKTGYTDEAGGCLIFLFSDEKGNIIINIILGAPSAEARIQEAQKLINYVNLYF